MDEYTADAFVNRDDPIPVLTITPSDDAGSVSELDISGDEGERRRLRDRLKGKAREFGFDREEEAGRQSMHDRLLNKLLQNLIPGDDPDSGNESVIAIDRRSSKYVKRPAFSLPLMTNNFRKFNARIGIVFVFQNRLIRLFSWRTPAHTLAFLAVYTFVCLNPYLLVVVPLAVLLLFVMVPTFVARHPPPPPTASTSSTTPYYSYHGPALAPARTIRPASETSKDFFRNMRDLQNSMADFSMLHDALISLIAPLTNFSDEVLSSQVFLYLTITTVLLFIAANVLPWRAILLVVGYSTVTAGHPRIQLWLHKTENRLRTKRSAENPEGTPALFGFVLPKSLSALPPLIHSISEITLDTAPETREVEIFELQHRPLISPGSTSIDEWKSHVFTPNPFDPLSPARISGERPRGTRFFEDVQPPPGWAWYSKKWELDLEAREWISERLITGVEFDVSAAGFGAEEFGGWVWDLPPLKEAYEEDDDIWLAYGGGMDDIHGGGGETKAAAQNQRKKLGKKELERQKRVMEEKRQKDWEEARHSGRTGEWRRRRWVRLVRRISLNGENKNDWRKQSTDNGVTGPNIGQGN